MRARKNGIHLQYAGEAPDIREAEQNAEDNRHCNYISMSPSSSIFHPSRCIDHHHIVRADRTYPMHPANAERWVSFASHHSTFPKQFVYDPNLQEQGIAKCTYASTLR